jgi:hypothetical protein
MDELKTNLKQKRSGKCVEIYLSVEAKERLRARAAKMDVSVSSFIKIALFEYYDHHPLPDDSRLLSRPPPLRSADVSAAALDNMVRDLDTILKEIDGADLD